MWACRPDRVLIGAGVRRNSARRLRAAHCSVRAAPPEPPGLRATHPGHGGMWACRPTPFDGGRGGESRACQGGYIIRRLQTRLLPFPAVGAHCICAHAAPPGSPGLQSSRPGPWRHVGMPPSGVGRGAVGIAGVFSGGHTGRPYGPAFGFLIGAGCMPARTGFRFAPGVDGSARRRGAHCASGPHRRNRGAHGYRNPVPAACGHAALRRLTGARWESRACQDGYIIRPYRRVCCRFPP